MYVYICRGNLNVGNNNMWRILDGDRYLNNDMIDLVSNRYIIEEKRNFLGNNLGYQGYNVVKLVCCQYCDQILLSLFGKQKNFMLINVWD